MILALIGTHLQAGAAEEDDVAFGEMHATSLLQTHVGKTKVLIPAEETRDAPLDEASCDGSASGSCYHKGAAPGATFDASLPRSWWFYAMEFAVGLATAKYLLARRGGKEGVTALEKPTAAQSCQGVCGDVTAAAVGRSAAAAALAPTLVQAVRDGDAERVAELLRAGAKVNATDDWGCTPLHVAADSGATPAVRLLLQRGAEVDAREAWDETPLHLAARRGSTEVCQVLLEHGALANAQNADDVTPLVAAAKAGHASACEALLECGGHAGDVADDDIPPLLRNLLFLRCLTSSSSS